jgi:hypothetical protein
MAGLDHQACGVLALASAARCPDRALLSKHSNQNEKPDLGQEGAAHDRDRKEYVVRRERVHECLASCEAPGVNHSGWKMFRFQTQTARDVSGVGIRGGLRRSPLRGSFSDLGARSCEVRFTLKNRRRASRACLVRKVPFADSGLTASPLASSHCLNVIAATPPPHRLQRSHE